MDVAISLALTCFVEAAMSSPLGGRWINKFDIDNSTHYDDYGQEATVGEHASNSCFPTLEQCNSRCPVSCREVTDCGGAPGTQYACSWDLIVIVVAVGVLTGVLFLLCFLTWKQRRGRRTQLEHGRVDSSENLLRRYSRQRAGSILAISSGDSAEGSRRNSYQPYIYPHYL